MDGKVRRGGEETTKCRKDENRREEQRDVSDVRVRILVLPGLEKIRESA